MKQAISLHKTSAEARFFGIISALIFMAVLFVPILIVRVYASLFLFITGWLFIFHFTTMISLRLEGTQRKCFQVALAIAFPSVLSMYFFTGLSLHSLKNISDNLPGVWLLIPLAFIGYMSWVAAEQLNRDHPFRGFIIASTILFFICYFGHHGIYYENDPVTGTGFMIHYREIAKITGQGGGYFALYLTYVAVSYTAMLIRFMIQRQKDN